jgi:type IV pilus assembly protein PilM
MATGLGIDVGADSIKVVQARVSGSTVTVTGALKIPRGQTVLDAPEDESGSQFVPESLGAELKRAGLSRSGTLGVSGREIILKYLSLAPMPPDKLKMVIDMEIGGKMTAKGGDADGPAVTYDYRLLNIPSGLKGDLIVMAAVCKNEYLFGINSSMKAAGLSAQRVTPSCFGLVNAYLRTQKVKENETVVLVDIGHELLEIAILEENRLYFARSAPGGGKKFTAALDKILKVGPQKAGEYKHGRAKIYPEGAQIPNKQELAFQAALKEGADAIASAIRSSVMFCRTQAKLPKLDYQRVFISGGGARLSGLREYLEKKCSRPVEILNLNTSIDLRKLDAASARCFEGDIPDMSVALGLAIIDADPKAFHFSLVPESVIRKQNFWRKTVFAAASWVVLLAGLWWPYQSSSAAVVAAQARYEDYKDRNAKAAKERAEFEKVAVEQNRQLQKRTEYYARQSRMGRIYVAFFKELRERLPEGTTLTLLGPAADENETADEAGSDLPTGGAPMMRFVVQGVYDTEKYTEAQFVDKFEELNTALRKIPGITNVTRSTAAAKEKQPRKDQALFRFYVKLQDPGTPLLAEKSSGPVAKTPVAKN